MDFKMCWKKVEFVEKSILWNVRYSPFGCIFGEMYSAFKLKVRLMRSLKLIHSSIVAFCMLLTVLSGCRSYDAALMDAIRKQEVGNVQRLLDGGAKADELTPGEHMLPLEAAAIGGNPEIVQMLIKHGAYPDSALGDDSPLWLALKNDHETAAAALVEAGARYDGPVRDGMKPFYCAAMLDYTQLVAKMAARGVDYYASGPQGTALHEAAENGNLSLVQMLATNKIDINYPNDLGETPIFLAAQQGKWEVVQWIAANGGKIDAVNHLGNTILHELAAKDDSLGIRTMCDLQINPDLQNVVGETPLHLAAAKGNAGAAIALIEICHADLNLRDLHLLSPAGLAYREGETDMVELLTARGGRLR